MDIITLRMIEQWKRHRTAVLRIATVVLFLGAAVKLGTEFHRLVRMEAWHGAIDLRMYYDGVHAWFDGQYVYTNAYASYPPATYIILWPLIGWLDFASARIAWAITSSVSLFWLALLLVKRGIPRCRTEQAFLFLIPFALNATGVTIGNGQLILHILPVLLSALLLLQSKPPQLQVSIAAGVLLALAMVKPTITMPFLWLVVFSAARLAPALAMGVVYIALTFFGLLFQPGSWDWHFNEWLARAQTVAAVGGYADLHTWMKKLGLIEWVSLGSISVFLLFGAALYFVRRADFWVLAGLCAIVARFWTIHRFYDNVLIVVPLLALFRIAKMTNRSTRKIFGGFLFATNLVALLLPAAFSANPAWRWTYSWGHPVLWLASFAFLFDYALLSHQRLTESSIAEEPRYSGNQVKSENKKANV